MKRTFRRRLLRNAASRWAQSTSSGEFGNDTACEQNTCFTRYCCAAPWRCPRPHRRRTSACWISTLPANRSYPSKQARGSTTYDGKLPSGYQFAFRVQEMDRDALAVYSCDAGKLFRGGYIFDPRTKPMPRRCTQPIKKRVTRELGAPSYDFASKRPSQKNERHRRHPVAHRHPSRILERRNSEAHASVAAPSKDRGWRVSLSYTANSHLDEGSLSTGT